MKVIILPFLVSSMVVSAQLYVNTDMAINGGGVIKVQNNSMHVGNTGNVENAGDLDIDYSYINNGVSTGFTSNTGVYTIGGDWENNNQFIADNSTVHLYNSDKLITGTAVTDFYTLILTGGSKLMTIDASAVVLDLGTDHLLTDENVMLVNNPDPLALIYSTGYVSSRGDGHLQRKTNSTSVYSFPLGSSTGDFRLRPLDFIPSDNEDNIFGARLANNDATLDGYNLQDKSDLVGNLNSSYYHNIYHNSGNSPVDITFYYDPSTDENFQTIGYWYNQWNTLDNVSNGGSNAGFESLVLSNFDDFSDRPFILANKNDFLYVPNSFTPNNDGKNDLLTISYDEEKLHSFSFLVFDRWGNLVLEEYQPNFSWDGSSKGQTLPEGAYVWKMNYQEKGKAVVVEKLGHVFILK